MIISPKLFLEWEMLQARVVDKIKTHSYVQYIFSPKNHAEGHRWQYIVTDNILFVCQITKATKWVHTHNI
jgi:hypothetical protein